MSVTLPGDVHDQRALSAALETAQEAMADRAGYPSALGLYRKAVQLLKASLLKMECGIPIRFGE